MAKRGPGRPTALTKRVREILVDHLGHFTTDKVACAAAGISQATLCNWKLRATQARQDIEAGRTPNATDRKYLELFEEVSRARAGKYRQALGTIATGLDDPQVAFRFLKMVDPDTYGGRTMTEMGADEAVAEAARAAADESRARAAVLEHITPAALQEIGRDVAYRLHARDEEVLDVEFEDEDAGDGEET